MYFAPIRWFAVLAMLLLAIPCAFAVHYRGSDEESANGPDPATVAEMAERRVENVPGDEKAWAELVQARVKSHDLARAQAALKRWREKVSNPGPAIENITGIVALEREEFASAVAAWKKHLELAPIDIQSWDQLGLALGRLRDWKQAAKAFTKELELHPTAKAYVQRARCYTRMHDWTSAEADARKANALGAAEKEVQKLFPIFQRSNEWLPKVKALDAAIEQDPKNGALLMDRAEILFAEGLISTGKDDLEAALKLRPESLRARFWNGALAWDRDQKYEAGETMKIALTALTPAVRAQLKAMDQEPNSEVRARFLAKLNQPVLALHEVQSAEGSPAKAMALLDLNRLAEAGPIARRAVEANPRDALAWLALARIEFKNGNYRETIVAAQKCSKIKASPEADILRKDATRRLGKK